MQSLYAYCRPLEVLLIKIFVQGVGGAGCQSGGSSPTQQHLSGVRDVSAPRQHHSPVLTTPCPELKVQCVCVWQGRSEVSEFN